MTKQDLLFAELEKLVIKLNYEIDYINMGSSIIIDDPKLMEAYDNNQIDDYEARMHINLDPPNFWDGKKLNKTYEKEKALREAIKELQAEILAR